MLFLGRSPVCGPRRHPLPFPELAAFSPCPQCGRELSSAGTSPDRSSELSVFPAGPSAPAPGPALLLCFWLFLLFFILTSCLGPSPLRALRAPRPKASPWPSRLQLLHWQGLHAVTAPFVTVVHFHTNFLFSEASPSTGRRNENTTCASKPFSF